MKRILIADDEVMITDLVRHILRQKDYDVIVASSGRECLEKAAREKPDAVILDVLMSDLNGFEVFRRLKSQDSGLKIIFLTVIDIDEEERKRLFRDGLSAIINKPFTPMELIDKVGEVLGRQERR